MSRRCSSRLGSSRTRTTRGSCTRPPTSSGSPAASRTASPHSSSRSSLDPGADDRLQVLQRDLLDSFVDRRARVGEHRDLEAELARVDRRLGDAALGRRTCQQEPLDLELAQDQLERGLVEGGVARLDDETIFLGGSNHLQKVTAAAVQRLLHEPLPVAVPDAVVVVRVDDRKVVAASAPERPHHPLVPFSERRQEPLPVLVLEIAQEVDEEKRVLHSAESPRICSAAARPRSCTARRRSSTCASSTGVSADSNSSRSSTTARDSSSFRRSSSARGSATGAGTGVRLSARTTAAPATPITPIQAVRALTKPMLHWPPSCLVIVPSLPERHWPARPPETEGREDSGA